MFPNIDFMCSVVIIIIWANFELGDVMNLIFERDNWLFFELLLLLFR